MSNKKEIGIITFSNTLDNYGQVLQYLATQEYLESRGHYAFLYKPLGSSGTTYSKIKHKLRRALKKVLRLLWYNRVVKKNNLTIVQCPATIDPEKHCATCGLCWQKDRKVVVAFPVHGNGKKKAKEAGFLTDL